MSGSDAMFLRNWLNQRRRPPSPIPAEVDKVNRHTEELRRWIAQMRAAGEQGRKP